MSTTTTTTKEVTQLKSKKELEQTFLKTRHTNVQQAYEKVFNITNHLGNANKPTMRYHLIPVRMAVIKKEKRQQMLERLWRNQNLCTVLVGMKNRINVPQNIITIIRSNIPTSGYTTKELKLGSLSDNFIRVFIAALFTTANLSVHLIMVK